MNQQNETSIIIADDHQLLREGFQRMFTNSCINIVAEAADGEELLQQVTKHQPEVVITVNTRHSPSW